MKNQVQLITYVDRLSGGGLKQLHALIDTELNSLFSGIHLLPFYYPIDGSDAGFDPIDHTQVDERLGEWQDVKALGETQELMADLIVNHMSAQSKEFQDVLKSGTDSAYWPLFMNEKTIFPNGISTQEQATIYRPRPGSCFTEYTLDNGEKVNFWTTFTDNQIDIDVESDAGKTYLDSILQRFAQNNIKMIRLDAAGYAIKRAGTNCFMLEETFDFIDALSAKAKDLGISTLVEIHSYYQTQIEIAKRVDRVYDFALPPLILHSIYTKNPLALAKWLEISPKNCITVLDTHDGIGIIDVGPMDGKSGLLTEPEINQLVETIHEKSAGESRLATGNAASNVDLYQVNCSYYDALGKDDKSYLLARAIQFFAPGIPQVYYGGLLAAENDMALLQETQVGRDINRPYLDNESVSLLSAKPVTQALFHLIKLRNQSSAFDGEFQLEHSNQMLVMAWVNGDVQAQLAVDFASFEAVITTQDKTVINTYQLSNLFHPK